MHAQRLWTLESPSTTVSNGHGDVYCFVSAVAVLVPGEVGVGFVRSLDFRTSTEACLRSARVRTTMERNFARFETLETALAWAETKKRGWLERGWCERNPDANES